MITDKLKAEFTAAEEAWLREQADYFERLHGGRWRIDKRGQRVRDNRPRPYDTIKDDQRRDFLRRHPDLRKALNRAGRLTCKPFGSGNISLVRIGNRYLVIVFF
jgi:hypothetical protein